MVASRDMQSMFTRGRKMGKASYYYLFQDGYRYKSASMSVARLLLLEHEHGKFVRKDRA